MGLWDEREPMITVRVHAEVLESVIAAASRTPNLTATEKWNIAYLANVAAEACLREADSEIAVAPI